MRFRNKFSMTFFCGFDKLNHRDDNRDSRRSQSYNSGSDDGMSYNPFAAFFNNKK